MMSRLKYELDNFEKQQLAILDDNLRKKRFYENLTPGYLKVVMFFTCFITITSFFFLNRSLRQRLRYQKELENKVDELHRSNEELEQLAHVASHDLQEPMRKMRTFTSRLLLKHSEKLDEEVKLILGRIEVSAVSMQELINDVVIFTNLTHSSENPAQVDLNDTLGRVIGDFQSNLEAKGVQIKKDYLPIIQGYPKQLYLLFKCLIENSLKFTREGVVPEIQVKLEKTSIKSRDFYKISVEDNGIGFENMFNEKIFIIFQRLHGQQSEYYGKGIGLAITKRIVINHKGIILATGRPGNGATFDIYLPVQ
jgi:light-regulated signal transduction histidine kinase (bacteriophytochrome)